MKDFIKEFAEAKEYKVSLFYNIEDEFYLSFSNKFLNLMDSKKYTLIKSFEI